MSKRKLSERVLNVEAREIVELATVTEHARSGNRTKGRPTPRKDQGPLRSQGSRGFREVQCQEVGLLPATVGRQHRPEDRIER